MSDPKSTVPDARWSAAKAELDAAHCLLIEREGAAMTVALHVVFALRQVLADADEPTLPAPGALGSRLVQPERGFKPEEATALAILLERIAPACEAYIAGSRGHAALAMPEVRRAFVLAHRAVGRLHRVATRQARLRSYRRTAAVAAVLVSAAVVSWHVLAPQPAFYGRYYKGIMLTGTPVVRADKRIDFDWLSGEPMLGLGRDTFSVRWDTCLRLKEPDTLEFRVGSDDGSRVFVDGKLLVNAWHSQAGEWNSAISRLPAGMHAVRVEYYERAGDAMVVFKVTRGSGAPVEDAAFDPPTIVNAEARCAP